MLYARLGDLIERDTVLTVRVQPQNIGQVPGDRLALAVRVGGKIDTVTLLGRLFQLLDECALPLDNLISRLKVVLNVDTQARLRQIAHMAHGGGHLIAAAQIFFDGLRLGGRLHDYKL